MPGIPDPNKFAEMVAELDELKAKFAAVETERDAFKADVEGKTASLIELTNTSEALKLENDTLKDELEAAREQRDQFEAEYETLQDKHGPVALDLAVQTSAVENLRAELEAKNAELEAKNAETATLEQMVEGLTSYAAESEEKAQAVQDQLALLSGLLLPKGAIPDIEEVKPSEVSENYKNWKTLSQGSSTDRMAARKLYAQFKDEIDAAIAGVTAKPAVVKEVSEIPAEHRVVYEQWKALRQEAKDALNHTSGLVPKRRQEIHTEKTVEARMLYNKNKAAIDACIAAQSR